MENISTLAKKTLTSQKNSSIFEISVCGNVQPIKFNENGKAFVSVYTDPVATEQQAAILLQPFFATYRIPSDARTAYIATVLNEEMTFTRLRDSLNRIYATRKQDDFGYPLPADIVNFDKENKQILFFNAQEMGRMVQNYLQKAYDYNKPEIRQKSTQIYEAAKNHFFEMVKKNGQILRDSEGQAIFRTTENFNEKFFL